ncbi:MAG TPA: hypothetical protein PKD59_07800, partial [Miltoncostaeaceae bacterium]|nr:hypothetical protein [Miltoncostaeaceae bacterium]
MGAKVTGSASRTAGNARVAAATRVGEEILHVAKREAAPAGQRLQALVANDVFPSATMNAREGD